MRNFKSKLARFGIVLLCGAFFAVASLQTALAVDFPKATGFVNDYAGILSPAYKVNLESQLQAFKTQTTNEIVVVIVNDLQGQDMFGYSQGLFTAWGIGTADKNNGVLFLVGPKEGYPFPEKGEAFINVGGGLEGALPDSLTGTILNREVFPYFKEKKISDGIGSGVIAIMQATKGEYKASGAASSGKGAPGGVIDLLMWGGFILISYLTSFLARSKSWWLGGVLGATVGSVFGFIFMSGLSILLPTLGIGATGLLFDYVVSKNYQKRLKEGKPTDFWHSGGGFWFGGRGGGGGLGGFGGFGGGSSRGGGAGGGW